MGKKTRKHGFVPPPHANAAVHKKIMQDLRRMTPKEVLQVAIEAGIYTPDGKLTEPYASGSAANGKRPARARG
jgi:hypothetical protein